MQVIVTGGIEGPGAVAVKGQAGGGAGGAKGQDLADRQVDIAGADAAADGGIFEHGGGGGGGRGGIVDGVYGDRNRGRTKAAVTVTYGNDKTIIAVKVGVGGIGIRTISINDHGAIARIGR